MKTAPERSGDVVGAVNSRTPAETVLLYANINPDICNAGTLHVSGLANAFTRNGHAVWLCVPRLERNSELAKMLSREVEVYAFPRAKLPGLRTVWSLGTVLALPRMLRLLWRRPALLHVRGDQSTWILHLLARLFRIRSVSECNSLVSIDRDTRQISNIRSGLFDFAQVAEWRLASKVCAVTEGLATLIARRGIQPDKIFVCGNGTDLVNVVPPARDDCCKRLNLPLDRINVGFLGHLVWWQGCDQLLAAFIKARARCENLALVFAGRGPLEPLLRKSARDHGVADEVHFISPVHYEHRSLVIGAFDIACFAGTAHRNAEQGVSPLKIRDYAAGGRAILAADLPGFEDLAAHNAILLYPPDNIDEMAARMVELGTAGELRHSLGANARRFAEENFDWTRAASDIVKNAQP